MDHIPLPTSDLAHAPIYVPFRCNEQYTYDDMGFLSYPDRVQVDVDALKVDRHPDLKLCDASPFLQAWLWFGLLGETLRVGSRTTTAPKFANSQNFIQFHKGQAFLSTRSIYETICAVVDRGRAPIYNEWYQTRVYSCLLATADFIKSAISTSYFKCLLQGNLADLDLPDTFLTLLSAQILCQTILAAKHVLFLGPLQECGREMKLSLKLVNYILENSGWCPCEIRKLPQDVRFRYHLSFYRQESHCTEPSREGTCKCPLPEEREVKPLHTHATCRCVHLSVKTPDLQLSLVSKQIPLFTFHGVNPGGMSLQMEMRPFDLLRTSPYVAISHIRRLGLGNDAENALPFCQLSRIQSLANQLLPSVRPVVPFWIDTLCLPIDRAARKGVVQNAKSAFENAATVLVLDPSLLRRTISSAEEGLIYIRYSIWKRRLWTVQEGCLAQSVQFCFANRVVSLGELLDEYSARSKELYSYGILPKPIASSWEHLWDMDRIVAQFASDVTAWLQYLSLSGRSGDSHWPVQRQHKSDFYKILRVGYLSTWKFRFFAEECEQKLFALVHRALFPVYTSSNLDLTLSHTGDIPIAHVVSRLAKAREGYILAETDHKSL